MLEERIEKSLLGKIRDTVQRKAGVYLLAAGLATGGAYRCEGDKEEKRVSCTPKDGGIYCGEYGTSDCTKPESASDDECECDCHYPWDPAPPEPNPPGCMNGLCCMNGMCGYESSISEVE